MDWIEHQGCSIPSPQTKSDLQSFIIQPVKLPKGLKIWLWGSGDSINCYSPAARFPVASHMGQIIWPSHHAVPAGSGHMAEWSQHEIRVPRGKTGAVYGWIRPTAQPHDPAPCEMTHGPTLHHSSSPQGQKAGCH